MHIAGTGVPGKRLVVGSFQGHFDFYLDDERGREAPIPLECGAERPTIRLLIDALGKAGLQADLSLRAVAIVAMLEPNLLYETGTDADQALAEVARELRIEE